MKLKQLLSKAWLISLIPFIGIIIFYPFNTKKYNLNLLRTDLVPSGHYIFYDDLDNDGTSERIVAFDQYNASGISVSNRAGIINQWNFRGSFEFGLKKSILIIGDKENDGKKEIYAFTFHSDSILLSIISNLGKNVPSVENRFVAVVGKGIKNPDPNIIATEMSDLDHNGVKELVFGINTGFSHFPRKLFAYYIEKDSLVTSPETGYFIQGILQKDINNDGDNEFLPYGYAAGNVSPDQSKYHDHNSFLLAFDKNLKFLFEPVLIGEEFSSLTPFIKYSEEGDLLACIYGSARDNLKSKIYTFDLNGTIRDSVTPDFYSQYIGNVSNKQYFIPMPRRGFALYDKDFQPVRTLPFKSAGSFLIRDLDGDKEDEYVLQVPDEGKLYVYRAGLNHPASLKLTIALPGWDILTVRTGYGTGPVMSIQTGQNHYLVEYEKNPNYNLSFLYYPGLYLAIFLFAHSLMSITRNQLRKRYENEKKMSELQLALIRNQLEPHFILNAINSVIYSVNFGEKDKATDSLTCFSSMYRDLVLSASESRRNIEQEIEFCKNYLTLEKLRFGDRFNYNISYAEDVDLQKLIPKFLIQIHAENSIKHGIAPLVSGGLLTINVKKEKEELVIEIKDNGVGRKNASTHYKGSTGKGLSTMKELYSLYSKLYNEEIISEITDLYDESNKPAGTRVIIRIKAQP